ELPVVPAREDLPRVRRGVIGLLQEVTIFVELLSPPGGDFVLVKPPRNAQLRLSEGIVIPPDAADNGTSIREIRIPFQPVPSGGIHPPWQIIFEQPIAIVAAGPQLVIPSHKKLWPAEGKSRQALLDRIAVSGCRVADDEQQVELHRIDLIDQLVGQTAGF